MKSFYLRALIFISLIFLQCCNSCRENEGGANPSDIGGSRVSMADAKYDVNKPKLTTASNKVVINGNMKPSFEAKAVRKKSYAKPEEQQKSIDVINDPGFSKGMENYPASRDIRSERKAKLSKASYVSKNRDNRKAKRTNIRQIKETWAKGKRKPK